MPFSAGENANEVRWFIKKHNINSVLDVGAGSGTYADMMGHLVNRIDAVEIWQPYVEQFNLSDKYDHIIVGNVLDLTPDYFDPYDLIIFGDVLEHMTKEDSVNLWCGLEITQARYGMISVPIVHYPQGAEFGNPFEEHVQEHLTPDAIRRDYGPFVNEWEYEITGTFIKDFNNGR